MIEHIKNRLDIVGAAIFLVISFVMLNTNYSYWWDELYSVTESMMGIQEMVGYAMMRDQHPPLYHFCLKIWTFVFGYNEFSTRSLSLVFVFLSFLAIYKNKVYFEDRYNLFVAVYLCSWPVLFYAHETRMYALLLLLATLIFIDYLKNGININRKAFILLILISLTHYFGFIASGLYLLIFFFSDPANKKDYKVYLLAFILWLSPLIHFIFGNIGSKLGGEFWITSAPLDAFYKFASLLLPMEKINYKLNIADEYLGYFTFICFTLTILAFHKNKLFFKFSSIIWCFLLLISVVDLHTPISTTRNFIVIFPLGVYCFASILYSINIKLVNALAIASLLYFSLDIAYKKTEEQANVALAHYIDNSGYDDIYFIAHPKPLEHWYTRMYNYYPEKKVTPIDLADVKDGDIVVGTHISGKVVERYKATGLTVIEEIYFMVYAFKKDEATAKN